LDAGMKRRQKGAGSEKEGKDNSPTGPVGGKGSLSAKKKRVLNISSGGEGVEKKGRGKRSYRGGGWVKLEKVKGGKVSLES